MDKGQPFVISPDEWPSPSFALAWNCVLYLITKLLPRTEIHVQDKCLSLARPWCGLLSDKEAGLLQRWKMRLLKMEGKKKKAQLWNSLWLSFPCDIGCRIFSQLFIHLVDFNHYFILLIRKQNHYCSKSYRVTWLDWNWVEDASGVCLMLPPLVPT